MIKPERIGDEIFRKGDSQLNSYNTDRRVFKYICKKYECIFREIMIPFGKCLVQIIKFRFTSTRN